MRERDGHRPRAGWTQALGTSRGCSLSLAVLLAFSTTGCPRDEYDDVSASTMGDDDSPEDGGTPGQTDAREPEDTTPAEQSRAGEKPSSDATPPEPGGADAPPVHPGDPVDPASASRGTLNGPISGWEVDTEPSWISMYEYAPENLAPEPPILVVVHFCSGNAVGVFRQAQDGGLVAAADQYGFIMVLPQTTRNCWDVATAASLTHDGGGDTGAIVHQVQYAISTYGANTDRVYIAGTSSGAAVTQAMLATYPDVFKAGVAFAGVPAGCWSIDNPDGQWSSPCAAGEVTHSAEEWGDIARDMFPGYSGFRPRIQLWHGDADSVFSFVNYTEALEQWTNVLGLPATPTLTTTETIEAAQYTRQQWQDSCGTTVLDAWAQAGGPHGTDANMNAAYTIPFFALDQADALDRQAAALACDGSDSM